MATGVIFLNWVLPLLYLAVLLDYATSFFLRTDTRTRKLWLPMAAVVHALFLVLLALRLGRLPLAGSYEILSILALATAVVYWIVELISRDYRTGVFVLLLVFLSQYTSSAFLARVVADISTAGVAAPPGWAQLHILPAILTYTAAGISAVHGLLYIVAQRNLKRHYFGPLFDRLPPLDLLGRMTWLALVVAFACLTLTMISGPIMYNWAGDDGLFNSADSKVLVKMIVGAITWLIYLAAVLGRNIGRWSPLRVSVASLIGFVAVTALLVASTILS